MADSKLSDLPAITQLANDDVLYVADVSQNASNKITYGNLINTKFTTLETNFDTVSALARTNESQLGPIRTEVITQTGREGFFNLSMDPITVTTSTAFRTAFSFAYETVSSTCPSEFELGDILTPTFTNIGGLSSLHVYAAPISSMSIQLTIVNNGTAAQTLTSSGGGKNLYVKVDYNRATT